MAAFLLGLLVRFVVAWLAVVMCWDNSRRVIHMRPIRLQKNCLHIYDITVPVGNSQMIECTPKVEESEPRNWQRPKD